MSLRGWSRSATVRLEPLALATLSLGAAAIHFAVISAHFAEFPLFGAFFALIGWFQALWAIAYAIRPARLLALLGIAANGVTIGLWIWAHMLGLPFGPDPGSVEPTGLIDLMATLLELLLVVWLIALVVASVMRRTSGGASGQTGLARSIVLIALIVTIAIGTTVALAQPLM